MYDAIILLVCSFDSLPLTFWEKLNIFLTRPIMGPQISTYSLFSTDVVFHYVETHLKRTYTKHAKNAYQLNCKYNGMI